MICNIQKRGKKLKIHPESNVDTFWWYCAILPMYRSCYRVDYKEFVIIIIKNFCDASFNKRSDWSLIYSTKRALSEKSFCNHYVVAYIFVKEYTL